MPAMGDSKHAVQTQQSVVSNVSRRTVTSTVSRRGSPVDHGYAWLIALASGVSFFMGAGFIKSYTMVYEQLLLKFGESATATAVVSSLHGGVKMCSSQCSVLTHLRHQYRCIQLTRGVNIGTEVQWQAICLCTFAAFCRVTCGQCIMLYCFPVFEGVPCDSYRSFAGPIVSAMVNMFGAQRVTIAGALVTFAGFTMSAFPPTLYYMYISHGVISGNVICSQQPLLRPNI